jgi:hypothetical protein
MIWSDTNPMQMMESWPKATAEQLPEKAAGRMDPSNAALGPYGASDLNPSTIMQTIPTTDVHSISKR